MPLVAYSYNVHSPVCFIAFYICVNIKGKQNNANCKKLFRNNLECQQRKEIFLFLPFVGYRGDLGMNYNAYCELFSLGLYNLVKIFRLWETRHVKGLLTPHERIQ